MDIAGGVSESNPKRGFNCKLSELTSLLEKFWIVEDLEGKGQDNQSQSEANKCEEHFLKNTTRQRDGRYVVRLPFKENDTALGVSNPQALRRFYSLQKRLDSDSDLRLEYHKVMQEYIDLGHMTLVNDEQELGYYIPHHPVIKHSSITTKVRVVSTLLLKLAAVPL